MRTSRTIIGAALVVAAFAARAPSSRAEGEWTLMPEASWSDQFSPLWIDEDGVLCEGNPAVPDEPPMPDALISRNVWDPDNEVYVLVQSIANEVLVNFTATTVPADIEDLFEDLDVSIVSAWYEPDALDASTSMSWFHIRINPTSDWYDDEAALIASLGSMQSVEFAEFNDLAALDDFPEDDPDDTYYGNQDEIVHLNADDAWTTTTGGDNEVCVVVVDSGVDVDHEDLDDKIYVHPTANYRLGIAALKDKTYYGDVDSKSALRDLQTGKAGHGHGTCVAGIIGAETNNDQGVAGCGPDLRLLSARLYMPSDGSFTVDSLVRAIKKVRKKLNSDNDVDNARVVNMSLSITPEPQSVGKAIRKDQKFNDRLYVAAAGNSTNNSLRYPAAWSYVLGVTGAERSGGNDIRHSGSNWRYTGGSLNRNIYGISGYFTWGKTTDATGSAGYDNSKYKSNFNGTSAATPQISALAGLLYSFDPDNTTEDEVSDHIKQYTKGSDHSTISFTYSGSTKYIPAVADFDRAVTNW